jgi:hypothetical protein
VELNEGGELSYGMLVAEDDVGPGLRSRRGDA